VNWDITTVNYPLLGNLPLFAYTRESN